FLDRNRLAGLVERPIDDREPAAADLPIDAVVEERVAAGQRLVGGGHSWKGQRRGAIGRYMPASRVPELPVCLARGAQNAYILPMPTPNVKPKVRASGRLFTVFSS